MWTKRVMLAAVLGVAGAGLGCKGTCDSCGSGSGYAPTSTTGYGTPQPGYAPAVDYGQPHSTTMPSTTSVPSSMPPAGSTYGGPGN